MSEAFTRLKPKDTFEVKYHTPLSTEDSRVLTLLYQPIIGVNSFGFYHNLLENAVDFFKPTSHITLMDLMDLGIPQLYEARIRLEAIGLVKTYVRPTDEGHHFIYVLQKVLPPDVFFTDDMLSLLLLDRLGEKRFRAMVKKFKALKLETDGYFDVTQTYTDVFTLTSETLLSKSDIVDEIKVDVTTTAPTSSPIINEPETFHWELFVEGMRGAKLSREYLDNSLKSLVYSFHQLYNIDELTMQKYVHHALDYVTNQIDIPVFKKQIYQDYHKPISREKVVKEVPILVDKKLEKYKNDLKWEGFTQEDIETILACEEYPPLVFLKILKEQKRGFVAQNERWTVEHIVKNSRLANPVVNMLIHYILVGKNESSLSQNLFNAIANDWAQKGISTAKEAMKEARDVSNKNEQKVSKPYSGRSKKAVFRKETLPDWAKDNNEYVEVPVSAEEEAEIQELFNQLKNGSES